MNKLPRRRKATYMFAILGSFGLVVAIILGFVGMNLGLTDKKAQAQVTVVGGVFFAVGALALVYAVVAFRDEKSDRAALDSIESGGDAEADD